MTPNCCLLATPVRSSAGTLAQEPHRPLSKRRANKCCPEATSLLLPNKGLSASFRRKVRPSAIKATHWCASVTKAPQSAAWGSAITQPAGSQGRDEYQAHECRGDESAEDHHGHWPLDLVPGLLRLDRDRQQGQPRQQCGQQHWREPLFRPTQCGERTPRLILDRDQMIVMRNQEDRVASGHAEQSDETDHRAQ